MMPERADFTRTRDTGQNRWHPAAVTSPHLGRPVPAIAARDIPHIRNANRLQNQRAPSPRSPASQRATGASLLRRLAEASDRNRQLAEENSRLRRQLAHALGDQRASPRPHTRHTNTRDEAAGRSSVTIPPAERAGAGSSSRVGDAVLGAFPQVTAAINGKHKITVAAQDTITLLVSANRRAAREVPGAEETIAAVCSGRD